MAENPSTPRVVLSADDDESAHLLMSMAFRKVSQPASLVTVNDGIEAIQYLSGEGKFADRKTYPLPDLLLLDLKMPKVSGFGVLEHLCKQPALKTFPVVVFSSSDHEVDVKKAEALGCDHYVVKPASFERLIELVQAIHVEFFNGEKKGADGPSTESFSRIKVQRVEPQQPKTPTAMTSQRRPVDSPEIFRLLIEQVKDYAIFMLDTDGYILSWNEGARRIKGYEAAEIIGKHFSTFYSQYDRDSHKPEFELRMAIEMGRYEEENWRVRKDGSRFWANAVITPLYDNGGKILGFAKVTRDLTQRKIQEEGLQKLLESEERFRLLVEQVKDYAIFILDAKGTISTWNQGARRLKGYTADEVLGKHFSMFYTEADIARDHPAKELSIAIREGRYEEEGWRVRKGGSRFWANVVITALWDKRGNLTGFAKVTKDLSERKKEEDALRGKTEELEAFAHTVSHDLRAPLRAITSFSQILAKEGKDLPDSDRALYAAKILKSAQAMDLLINDVLKLSHLSVAPFTAETIPLDTVMEEALGLLENDVRKTNARIEIRKPLPTIRANRTLLVQIFTNLFSNALKFTREGEPPRIEVHATKKNGDCEIHVKDHGVGIPQPFHRSIFNPFERGQANPNTAGTGVGLTIVKRATERLGGSIALKSAEGEGTEFIVMLSCDSTEQVPAGG